MNHLAGKVMYITGGTKGIGLGILKEALNHGMKVAVSARNIDTLDTTAFSKDNFLLLHSDVKKAEDEQAAVAKIKAQWGQLDVLIANAGVGHFVPIDQMTSAQWHDTIDTNLTGVFNSVQAAIPMLKESQGYIITVASLAGTNFFPQASAYNASKFGLVGFSQAIMLDNHVPNDADAWKIQPEDIGKLVIDLLTMNPRTLPSKIEVRPSQTS